jgi:hypothetical protein
LFVWSGAAALGAAAIINYMRYPNEPVQVLGWPLIWFAWFKVLLIADIRWQRQHEPEHYQALVDHHGGAGSLRSYVWYRGVAAVALLAGACVCFVMKWN